MNNETSEALFHYSVFTEGQQIVLLVFGWISSILSLFGSISIIYLILKNNLHSRRGVIGTKGHYGGLTAAAKNAAKLSTPSHQRIGGSIYHRILLGLSVSDIISSLAFVVQPIAMLDTLGYLLAAGTIRSCAGVAFVQRSYQSTVIYNAMLNLYFYMTVKKGKTEEQTSKLLEPYIHLVAVLIPLIIGAVSAGLKMLNPLAYFGTCGVDVFPAHCVFNRNVPCVRGSPGAYPLLWSEAAVSILFGIFGIFCTWSIVWEARKQSKGAVSGGSSSTPRPTAIAKEYNKDEFRKQRKRNRLVAQQAMLYTAAFVPLVILVVSRTTAYFVFVRDAAFPPHNDGKDYSGLYALVFLFRWINPSQGILNWYIFVRRSVKAWKNYHHDKGWFHAYRQVLTGQPPPTQREIALARRRREHEERQKLQEEKQSHSDREEGDQTEEKAAEIEKNGQWEEEKAMDESFGEGGCPGQGIQSDDDFDDDFMIKPRANSSQH